MIVQEHFEVGGVDFVKTYSDRGMKIYGGDPEDEYTEACDPASLGRAYTETDIPIEGEDTAEDILNIIMGVSE